MARDPRDLKRLADELRPRLEAALGSPGPLLFRGAGTAVAQKALRHSDVRLTIHTYGHLDDGDLKDGIAKAFGPAAEGVGAVAVRTDEPEPVSP